MLTPMLAGRILAGPRCEAGRPGTRNRNRLGVPVRLPGHPRRQRAALELHGCPGHGRTEHLRAAGFEGIEVTTADGAALVSETAYDVIVLTASLRSTSRALRRALKYGGRLFA